MKEHGRIINNIAPAAFDQNDPYFARALALHRQIEYLKASLCAEIERQELLKTKRDEAAKNLFQKSQGQDTKKPKVKKK